MPLGLDIAVVVAPAITAGAGGWWGARMKFRHDRKTKFGTVVDEASRALEIADQRGNVANMIFSMHGAPLPPEGQEALGRLRETLSTAAVLREEMALDVERTSTVYLQYDAALEALGRVSQILGVIATYPDRERSARHVGDWHEGMDQGFADFKAARTAFTDAARQHLRK